MRFLNKIFAVSEAAFQTVCSVHAGFPDVVKPYDVASSGAYFVEISLR